jgi:hypothetical protein
MKKVYIASPYTLGDVAVNVKVQMDCANELIGLGFAPYVPLLSHFLHMANPRPYEDWTRIDKEWVIACDYVLRLPGESKGADEEVRLAVLHGIPVACSVSELLARVKA